MKQNAKRRALRFPIRSEMKTMFKKVMKLAKDGNLEEAKKVLPLAYKVIDMAEKRNILHGNTAARRKSRMAKAINELEANGGVAKVEKKAAKPPKKEKKVEKVEEKAEEVVEEASE